jgi:hypothetical protein
MRKSHCKQGINGASMRSRLARSSFSFRRFAVQQAEPEFDEIDGNVIARTRETARWRETGEVAYEADFALRLTLDDERIVRIVAMPEGGRTDLGGSRAVHGRTFTAEAGPEPRRTARIDPRLTEHAV